METAGDGSPWRLYERQSEGTIRIIDRPTVDYSVKSKLEATVRQLL